MITKGITRSITRPITRKIIETGFGPPPDPYGAELITNGGFDADTNWVKGTGWSISGGTANATSSQFFSVSQTSFPLVAGTVYRVSFDITVATSGGVRPTFSGSTQMTGTTATAVGTHVAEYTANSGNNQFNIQQASGGFVGSVDNVSVREVL